MEQAELDLIRDQFDGKVRELMPGAPIERIEVLQYGDDPEIEPGQLLAQIVVEAPGDESERGHAFESFHDERRAAFRELRQELDKLPIPVVLKFTTGGEPAEGEKRGPILKLAHRVGPGGDGPNLTPVMARLGVEDLATLDTLITVGIAGSRAEAVRWALARIRERPAFEQLRAHTREIETLKSQF